MLMEFLLALGIMQPQMKNQSLIWQLKCGGDLNLSDIPWQEELYLRAEINKRDGVTDAFYDAELFGRMEKNL